MPVKGRTDERERRKCFALTAFRTLGQSALTCYDIARFMGIPSAAVKSVLLALVLDGRLRVLAGIKSQASKKVVARYALPVSPQLDQFPDWLAKPYRCRPQRGRPQNPGNQPNR